ncbi:MAG: EMC3/TMCO1 family protein [archaeon]
MVEILYNAIEAIFAPLIKMGPIYAITGISTVISLLLSIAYKFLVNQSKVKYIRAELKELKTKMNAAKKKGSEKELKSLFDKSLKLNNQQLMLNMKPLMASMVLITLFLPWLGYAYGDINVPIENNRGTYTYDKTPENFMITENSAPTITFENSALNPAKDGDEIRIADRTYKIDIEKKDDKISNVKFTGFRADLPFKLPIFGNIVGWLGLYIIISMPTTFLFRKILNVE